MGDPRGAGHRTGLPPRHRGDCLPRSELVGLQAGLTGTHMLPHPILLWPSPPARISQRRQQYRQPLCGLRQRKCISGSWFMSIYTPLFSLSYVPQANGTQFTLLSQSTTVLGIEPISRPGQVMLWLQQAATADWACCSHSGFQAAAGATVSKVADCPASSGGPCAGN